MRFVSFLVASALLSVAADPTGEPKFLHPLIQNHGGVVALPEAAGCHWLGQCLGS